MSVSTVNLHEQKHGYDSFWTAKCRSKDRENNKTSQLTLLSDRWQESRPKRPRKVGASFSESWQNGDRLRLTLTNPSETVNLLWFEIEVIIFYWKKPESLCITWAQWIKNDNLTKKLRKSTDATQPEGMEKRVNKSVFFTASQLLNEF